MYAKAIAGLYRGRKSRLMPSLYDPLTQSIAGAAGFGVVAGCVAWLERLILDILSFVTGH